MTDQPLYQQITIPYGADNIVALDDQMNALAAQGYLYATSFALGESTVIIMSHVSALARQGVSFEYKSFYADLLAADTLTGLAMHGFRFVATIDDGEALLLTAKLKVDPPSFEKLFARMGLGDSKPCRDDSGFKDSSFGGLDFAAMFGSSTTQPDDPAAELHESQEPDPDEANEIES
jgi:hypothetical protein